jgi:multimeric flavodoxin WrbA
MKGKSRLIIYLEVFVMGNIILITGSARKNGNSIAMADSYEVAAKEKGFEIRRIDATKLEIGVCHVCNTCYDKGKACTFDDDFNKIADDLINADGIVVACPVYWYTFPAKVKALIDKFYALYEGGHMFTGKKCALISCCADTEMEAFDGINFAFDKTFTLMGAEIVGKVEIAGVNEAGAIKNTDGEAQAAKLSERFV